MGAVADKLIREVLVQEIRSNQGIQQQQQQQQQHSVNSNDAVPPARNSNNNNNNSSISNISNVRNRIETTTPIVQGMSDDIATACSLYVHCLTLMQDSLSKLQDFIVTHNETEFSNEQSTGLTKLKYVSL